jgi:hypothetical protein
MKKITFTLLTALGLSTGAFGQVNVTIQAPLYDGSNSSLSTQSGSVDAVYHRSCWLVLQSELAAMLTTNSLVTNFALDYTQGNVAPAATGNFTISFQNTPDVAYSKGTAWPALLTGMTNHYVGPYTLPTSNTFTSVTLALNTPFAYTGGGVYVALEWYGPTAANTQWSRAQCNTTGLTTTGGVRGIAPAVGPAPTTLSTSAFRPAFGWIAGNTATNEVSVEQMFALGQVSKLDGSGEVIEAVIRNNSSVALTNVNVNLNIAGANPFTNSKVVASVAAGSFATVSFNPFSATVNGLNTMTVSVASDQNNTNNFAVWAQSVTCNDVAVTPAAPSSSFISSAYSGGTGGGIIAFLYTTGAAPSSVTAISMVVPSFTAAGNLGNSAYAVLCDASGVILDQGNPVTFNPTNMDVFTAFSLSAPQALLPNTDYYLGVASTGTNFCFGNLPSNEIVYGNYRIPLAGGSPVQTNLGYTSLKASLTFSNLAISASPSKSVVCRKDGPLTVTLTATGLSTYTWTPGGVGASIAVTPSVAGTTGTGVVNYFVTGTDAGSGCKSVAAKVTVSVSACTGLADNNSNGYNINVFPNPSVSGKSAVNGLIGTNVITVYNTLGQVVLNQTVSSEIFEIDLSNQASGNYMVKITDSNSESRIIKLVNQN